MYHQTDKSTSVHRSQVTISLLMAQFITTFLWKRGLDPDMYAMPIQSSLIDLISQILLVICYELAEALGSKVGGRL